jgi:hypothetical protein
VIHAERVGQGDIAAMLKGFEDQIPFATVLTLTRTAKDVQQAEKGHLRGVLDRPTRFTLNAIRVKPATKRDMEARIWIRDEADKGTAPIKYLEALVRGGTRGQKRHEKALQRKGILPAGWFTVPGEDMRLNRFGNITAGMYTKILSGLQASSDEFQNSMSKLATRRYFVMRKPRSRAPLGIYQRTSKRRIKSILHFVPSVTYSPVIEFVPVAEKVIARRLDAHMRNAVEQVIRTAGQRSARTTRAELLGRLDPQAFL